MLFLLWQRHGLSSLAATSRESYQQHLLLFPLGDAENALVQLQGLLAEYELLVNPRKTGITEMPAGLEYADVIDSVILRHAPLAHGSEVAWSL